MNLKHIGLFLFCLNMLPGVWAAESPSQNGEDFVSLQQAAQAGNAQAQAELGEFYIAQGEGPKAWPLLKASAKQKDPEGLFALGYCYETGQCGEKQNYKKAVKYYKKAAQKNNSEAMYRLALLTHDGDGTKADVKKAVSYMLQAADLGSASAIYFLALAYTNGQEADGIKQDYKKAVPLWKKLAAAGQGEACFNLGYFYYYGYGVQQDLEQAFAWDLCAAQRGLPQGQYQVGLAYIRGEGVPEDVSQGMQWIQQAADQGFEPAQQWLSTASYFLYTGPDLGEKGIGKVESVPHLKKRAEEGSAAAQYLYGSLCEQKPDVVGEPCDADFWYQKAAAQGLEAAIEKLKTRAKK